MPEQLTLTSGEIHLWRAWLNPETSQTAGLLQTLSPDERQRAARFHFERDRQHFIAGRGILRAILGRYLGWEPSRLKFSYGPHGKPALAEPASTQLCFNLAHSGGLAIYAFVLEQEIGVDVEQIQPIAEMEQIAERFFAGPERVTLLALPPEQRPEAFFNGWTRKEAYLKALGDGLARPLDQFWVSLKPGQPARLESVAGDKHEAAQWWLKAFNPAPDYVAAVAVRGQSWQTSYWDWFPTGI